MVVMMIVLVALGTIAGLTVISVQGSSASTNAQRFSAMALYAAESGAAATMEWLKGKYDPARKFSDLVEERNNNPLSPADIPGNNDQPGTAGNLLSPDQQGWYEVVLLNNRGDQGFAAGDDKDDIIIIQVTGHGPNGAVKKLEWEVFRHPVGNPPLTLLGWHDVF